VTLAVDAGYHHDILLEDAIVQSIRKPGQQDPARIAVNDRVGLRLILKGRHSNVEGTTERRPQPRTLCFVPLERVFNVGLGIWREDGRLHRDFRRSRTSDH
jgi:hypothetical protein